MKKINRQRLPELSLMNCLLCLFVLFIHVSGSTLISFTPGSLGHLGFFIPWWIASVAVYGFIFLSGLKLCLNIEKPFELGKFYWKRAKAILFPYILWVVIYYIISLIQNGSPFSFKALGNALITGNITSHLYFIVVILQFYLLAPLWRWCVQKIHPGIALPIALCLSCISLVRLNPTLQAFNLPPFQYTDRFFLTHLFFWLSGCYVGAYYQDFKKGIQAHPLLCSVAFFIATALDLYVGFTNTVGTRYLPLHTETHLLFLIIAILFFYMLCLKGQRLYQTKGIALLDRSSFAIYLSHIFIMNILAEGLIHLLKIQNILSAFAIRTLITFGLSLLLCMAYTKLKSYFLKKRG